MPPPSIVGKDLIRVEWSVITVTYNSAEQLRSYFRRPPSNVEWMVVDNASSDDSVALARHLGAKVIELDENRGFSSANNIGIRASSGPFVACINPDVAIEYKDLARASTVRGGVMDGRLVAPQLLNPDHSLQPNGRGIPTLARKLGNRMGDDKESYYRVYNNTAALRRVAWVIGAAVLARRDVWSRLGGWDERFYVYYEDHDLGLRAWRSGIEVVVDGSMQWVHGWDRATSGRFRVAPWLREIDGFVRFFSRYPGLLLGEGLLPKPLAQNLRPAVGTYVGHASEASH